MDDIYVYAKEHLILKRFKYFALTHTSSLAYLKILYDADIKGSLAMDQAGPRTLGSTGSVS